MKILHIISELGAGGAENMLSKLISQTRPDIEHRIITLTKSGVVGDQLKAQGLEIFELGLSKKRPNLIALVDLIKQIHQISPDLIQTWMYHSDLLGGIAGFLTRKPVVWGVRSANIDPAFNHRLTLLIAHLNAIMSKFLPSAIIFNSQVSRDLHFAIGYSSRNTTVIPNGFDTALFCPDANARKTIRLELGIPPNAVVIGLIARFDPLKGHEVFFRAMSSITRPDVHFILCGKGIEWSNHKLTSELDENQRSKYHFLGLRTDVSRIMAALDIAVSSSHGEAFPNSIGEAMACQVPCVVTNVGDAAMIVGETGIVVRPNDHRSLANACELLIAAGSDRRRALGERARCRIQQNFSMTSAASKFVSLYSFLVNDESSKSVPCA